MAIIPSADDFIGQTSTNLQDPAGVRFPRDPYAASRRLGNAIATGAEAIGAVAQQLEEKRQGVEDARYLNYMNRETGAMMQQIWEDNKGLPVDELFAKMSEGAKSLHAQATELGYKATPEMQQRVAAQNSTAIGRYGKQNIVYQNQQAIEGSIGEYNTTIDYYRDQAYNDPAQYLSARQAIVDGGTALVESGAKRQDDPFILNGVNGLAQDYYGGLIQNSPQEALRLLQDDEHQATVDLSPKSRQTLIDKAEREIKQGKANKDSTVNTMLKTAAKVADGGGDPFEVVSKDTIYANAKNELEAQEAISNLEARQRTATTVNDMRSMSKAERDKVVAEAVEQADAAERGRPTQTVQRPRTYTEAKETARAFLGDNVRNIDSELFNSPAYKNYLHTLEEKYELPRGILYSIAQQESALGDNQGPSSAGALGPFQFMPETAKLFGIDPMDAIEAAEGAARHLADERNTYKRNGIEPTTELLLRGYNHSIEGVMDNVRRGTPLPSETTNYSDIVQRNMANYSDDVPDFLSVPAQQGSGAALYTVPIKEGSTVTYVNIPGSLGDTSLTEEEAKEAYSRGELDAVGTYSTLEEAKRDTGILNQLSSMENANAHLSAVIEANNQISDSFKEDGAGYIQQNANQYDEYMEASLAVQELAQAVQNEQDPARKEQLQQQMFAAVQQKDILVDQIQAEQGIPSNQRTALPKATVEEYVRNINSAEDEQRGPLLLSYLQGRSPATRRKISQQLVDAGMNSDLHVASSLSITQPSLAEKIAGLAYVEPNTLSDGIPREEVSLADTELTENLKELETVLLANGNVQRGYDALKRYTNVGRKLMYDQMRRGASAEDAALSVSASLMANHVFVESGSPLQGGGGFAVHVPKSYGLAKEAIEEVGNALTNDIFLEGATLEGIGSFDTSMLPEDMREEWDQARILQAVKSSGYWVNNGKEGDEEGMVLMVPLGAYGAIPVRRVKQDGSVTDYEVSFKWVKEQAGAYEQATKQFSAEEVVGRMVLPEGSSEKFKQKMGTLGDVIVEGAMSLKEAIKADAEATTGPLEFGQGLADMLRQRLGGRSLEEQKQLNKMEEEQKARELLESLDNE